MDCKVCLTKDQVLFLYCLLICCSWACVNLQLRALLEPSGHSCLVPPPWHSVQRRGNFLPRCHPEISWKLSLWPGPSSYTHWPGWVGIHSWAITDARRKSPSQSGLIPGAENKVRWSRSHKTEQKRNSSWKVWWSDVVPGSRFAGPFVARKTGALACVWVWRVLLKEQGKLAEQGSGLQLPQYTPKSAILKSSLDYWNCLEQLESPWHLSQGQQHSQKLSGTPLTLSCTPGLCMR